MKAEKLEYYARYESILNGVLTCLKTLFPCKDVSQIKEFISHGEYGLALDSLLDLVSANDISNPTLLNLIEQAKMHPTTWKEEWESHA